MVSIRMFAQAREAAGRGHDTIDHLDGATVVAVIDAARERYGPAFADVLSTCRIWLNGEAAEGHEPVHDGDEIAVLPPVSGG